jgi:hypothetical protein
VYLAAPRAHVWAAKQVDHNIVQVVSGISDTAMPPAAAAEMTARLLKAHWDALI